MKNWTRNNYTFKYSIFCLVLVVLKPTPRSQNELEFADTRTQKTPNWDFTFLRERKKKDLDARCLLLLRGISCFNSLLSCLKCRTTSSLTHSTLFLNFWCDYDFATMVLNHCTILLMFYWTWNRANQRARCSCGLRLCVCAGEKESGLSLHL